MQQVTLVYLFNAQGQVLLGMKKRKFGAGKWNGFGGKNAPGETIVQTALRELEEEAGIILFPEQLQQMGTVEFFWKANPEWNQVAYIFRGEYNGSFTETEEMKPQRFDADKFPYADMRENDVAWMPKLIAREYLHEVFHFDENGKRIK